MTEIKATQWTVHKHVSTNYGTTKCWAKIEFANEEDKEDAFGCILELNGVELEWTQEQTCAHCGEIDHIINECKLDQPHRATKPTNQQISPNISFNSLLQKERPALNMPSQAQTHTTMSLQNQTQQTSKLLSAHEIIHLVQSTIQKSLLECLRNN